nr:hypothetical protein [Tanacetum cinerariifolium]
FFHDALPASETIPNVVHVESSTNKTSKEMSMILRPDAPIIEDWTSDLKMNLSLSLCLTRKNLVLFKPLNM